MCGPVLEPAGVSGGSLKFDTVRFVRPIIFHPKARNEFADFQKMLVLAWRRGLYRLQLGEHLSMPDARPMKTIFPGVSELRAKGADGIFRVFYYVASAKGVLVFHAFEKKTQRTPPLEIELAKKRLKELLDA